VWATDINESSLATLAGCRTRILDVRSSSEVENAIAEIGPLDVLLNCAGIVAAGTILDCSQSDWDLSLDLNITSMFRTIRHCLPSMLNRGGGSIINISSVAGAAKGVPNRFVYGTTKAAVVGLTKSVAADYVTLGIRCNAICPGTIDTPSLHERLKATGDYESALSAFKARQPMRRLGEAREVAALALYLASDESAFTTGQCFMIDGGWSN
jgi:2-keto-3-deoxy-L-fuconate dehydrogenase